MSLTKLTYIGTEQWELNELEYTSFIKPDCVLRQLDIATYQFNCPNGEPEKDAQLSAK